MSSLNPAELGAFSDFVYKDTALTGSYPAKIPQGFTRVDVDPDTANGFYASGRTMGSGLANCIKVPVEGFGESRGLSRTFLNMGDGVAPSSRTTFPRAYPP
jgi:hypothetical protein